MLRIIIYKLYEISVHHYFKVYTLQVDESFVVKLAFAIRFLPFYNKHEDNKGACWIFI